MIADIENDDPMPRLRLSQRAVADYLWPEVAFADLSAEALDRSWWIAVYAMRAYFGEDGDTGIH